MKCKQLITPLKNTCQRLSRQVKKTRTGRGDRIRTCDLVVPNHALYQAKLRPDLSYQKCLAEISSPMDSPA